MTSLKGYGITFVDLDETLFHTFAKINVVFDGKIVKSLSNKEFNIYTLREGEQFDFSEFHDSKLFKETSVPIPEMVARIKKMIKKIKENKSFSRIIVLTARQDFWDKDLFLQAFIEQGIDVSDKNVFYIDRAGNIREGTIAEKKRKKILEYLKTGIYRRCRIIDDDLENINAFLELENNLPKDIVKKVRETYSLSEREVPIKFYALHMLPDGKLEKKSN